jgi:hypothetical protein
MKKFNTFVLFITKTAKKLEEFLDWFFGSS